MCSSSKMEPHVPLVPVQPPWPGSGCVLWWGPHLETGACALLSQTVRLSPQLVENCVCLLRNLSYQVHREIPHAERYQETPLAPANTAGPPAASCFGTKKGKGALGGGSTEGGDIETDLLW